MHWFILAVLAMAAAGVLWYTQAAGQGHQPASAPADGEDFRQWLEVPAVWEGLTEATAVLLELMADRELGGPGFLTLRLPQPGEGGAVTVIAQYPNIREVLYRHAARREMDRETLLPAGVPEALLALEPDFETDSGGVVVVSVRAAVMEEALVSRISGRTERQAALHLLMDRLKRQFPGLEVRTFGSELLLTPVRAEAR